MTASSVNDAAASASVFDDLLDGEPLDALLREPATHRPGDNPSLTGAAEQAERARRLLDAMLDEADHRLEAQQSLATAAR